MYNLDQIWETIIAILLALAGGLARMLETKDKRKMKWSRIFSDLFVSGFAGVMVLLLARASGLSGDWLGVAAGMAGWAGPRILDPLEALLKKKIGVKEE